MNDANITTNDLNNPEIPLDSRAGRMAPLSRLQANNRTVYLPTFRPPSNWQVREDKAFYIPDFLSAGDNDEDSKRHSAAAQHAKHLIQAEGLLGEVQSLVEVLIASLGDEVDARAMQTETALRVIEKKLRKAHTRIDKHDMRHTNLFLAYFDLKDKVDGE